MPKLIVKFEDVILNECVLAQSATIGRLPDNTVVIDNIAVSGHHARVFREGDSFVVEDLKSTNGTFVNEKPIARQTLSDGDAILVGKHTLVFDGSGKEMADEAEPTAGTFMPEIGGTVVLDTKHHRDLMNKLGLEPPSKAPAAAPSVAKTERAPASIKADIEAATAPAKTERPSAPAKTGVLRVLAGRTDRTEYDLTAHTSLIGKSDNALVRLKGWFKPKVAAAIARKGDGGYAVTRLSGSPAINGEPFTGRQDLKDGDVLDVSGVTLEFRVKS